MAIHSSSITNVSAGINSSRGGGAVRGAIRGANGAQVQVKEGQVLKGIVTDVRGNQVTIELEDGSSFTGKLPDASNYSIGQTAAFQVTSSSASVIYMKAISDAYLLGLDEMINKALDEATLPKSPRNVEIVRSLLNNQQSISRQSISDAIQLCARFTNNSVDSIITANHLKLPMTQETISQFEQYQNHTHQILFKMNAVADSVSDVMNLVGSQSPEAATFVSDKILSLVLENTLQSTMMAPDGLTLASDISSSANPTLDSNGNPIPVLDVNGNPVTMLDAKGTPIPDGMILLDENGVPIPSEQLILTPEGTLILAEPHESSAEIPFEANQIGSKIESEARTTFANLLEDFPLPEDLKLNLLNGRGITHDLLSALHSALPSLFETQAKALTSSPIFQELINNELLRGWTLSPEEITDTNAIETLYDKIDHQLSTLNKLSESLLSQKPFADLHESSSDVRNNLQFMKMLNDSFTYMQLPLQLTRQNAHADLYVMTRKGAMKKNPDKLKVLLHLEMESLGTLDIHVEKENTSVTTRFYVSDKKVKALFEKNMELLHDAINEQGYLFISELNLKEEDVDIVKDFIAKDIPIGNLKRYNFDLRA